MAECDRTILHRLMVDGHAVGSTYGILSAITLTDGVLFVELAVEVELEGIIQLTSLVV